MTAIKPAESRRVVAVAAETYPMNAQCAWPECAEKAVDPHHAFPRSAISGDSYFVSITFDTEEEARAVVGKGVNLTAIAMTGPEGGVYVTDPIPHCTGLCRAHHDELELANAKLALEEGKWLAYEEIEPSDEEKARWVEETGEHEDSYPVQVWGEVGELSPQPGSTEGKKKKRRYKGQARRSRTTISVRVPKDDQEDGAGLLDDKFAILREKLGKEDDYPPYYVISAALDFTLLNAGPDDFAEED